MSLYVDQGYFAEGGAFIDACYWVEGYIDGDLVCIADGEVGGDAGRRRQDDDEVLMMFIREFMERLHD